MANSWFSNNSNPIVPRNHLIQNQFGGSIGGPIMRDKLFFFFDFNDNRIISQALVNPVVPLDSLRNGQAGYYALDGSIGYLNATTRAPAAQIPTLQAIRLTPSESALIPMPYLRRFALPHSNSNGGDGVNPADTTSTPQTTITRPTMSPEATRTSTRI